MFRTILLLTCLFNLMLFGASSAQVQLMFYVGTFTSEGADGIYLCSLNTETGEVVLKNTFTGVDNPTFLRVGAKKEILYAVSRRNSEKEAADGFVIAYRIGENGELNFLNKQPANGSGSCYVDVSPDGKYVAIATYGGGTTSVYPLNDDGSLRQAIAVVQNTGKGIHLSQEKPHAHSIRFSKTEPIIFSTDLGTDQLNIFRFENGNLEPYTQEFVKLSPGSGPRHFDFHPSENVIYIINELNSTVSAIRKYGDKWSVFQYLSTLPADFDGENYCADIHISSDGRFLYGSNRGHNSISIFNVDKADQKMKLKGTVATEGNWPRNFGITPDGKWMLVANQRSHNITVFKMNTESGMPEFSGKQIHLPAPVCIEFL
ncbi:MAG TPA: lactonase family protein [Draconibacterium sp.]|nr:lactonase family protein [Draconibacterium sp.]